MAWPRGGYRKPRHGAGVASRIPRDPACDSGLRSGQLAAATRHAVRLAGPPVPARSPCGPARGGLGWPRMPLARSCRMLGGRLSLAPRGGPGAAVSEAGQGSRTGHEIRPLRPRLRGCRPPRQGAPLGVPGPESERSPATATLAGLGGHAPMPAPSEPPSCSLHRRCGDDQVGTRDYGPGRGLPGGRSGDRTRRRAASRNVRSRGLARRNLRWAPVPLTGPALELCGVNFAKSVMRQGFSGLTPHN